jgi:hypothetical protein
LQAIFCIKETIINHINNKKPCYKVSFDAEKAFDKLWRFGLFYNLFKKFGLSFTMIIKIYYDQSCGIVKNNDKISNIFKIDSGVKQVIKLFY